MVDPVHLRCVTALVHAVPGAHLTMETRRGDIVTIGRHPAADMTICSLRKMLMAQTGGGAIAVCDGIATVDAAGSVRPIGAGLHLASPGADVWFASTLVAQVVLREAAAATAEGVAAADGDGLLVQADVTVLPDEALGVTLVQISSDQVDPIAAAMTLCSRLLIAELEAHPARMRPY